MRTNTPRNTAAAPRALLGSLWLMATVLASCQASDDGTDGPPESSTAPVFDVTSTPSEVIPTVFTVTSPRWASALDWIMRKA